MNTRESACADGARFGVFTHTTHEDLATMDLATIEAALAGGNLWAAMRNGRYWRLRRNGATQTWKRDTARFRIPVKAGLKSCGEVTNVSTVSADGSTMPDFLISEVDPNVRANG